MWKNLIKTLKPYEFNKIVNDKRIEGVIDSIQETKIRTAYELWQNKQRAKLKKDIEEVL